MPAEKTIGIVLKVVDFSESSCVVTFYTREFGKITALAKGARRLRGPFEGAIDLLATCRILFLRKTVDKLDLLTEAKLERRFRSASLDLSRFYAGLYVVDLISVFTDPAESQPDLFDLLDRTIQQIDRPCSYNGHGSGMTVVSVLLAFELNLLKQLGHQPSLDACVGCGKPVTDYPAGRLRISFGVMAGGVYCEQCRIGKRKVVGIKLETLQLMKRLVGHPAAIDSLETKNKTNTDRHPEDVSPICVGELRGLMDQYISNLIGFRPRTQSCLKAVFSEV